MLYYKFNEFVQFCIFVVTVISISHTNGMKINYIKMFPKIGENVTLPCSDNHIKNGLSVSWKMNHKELPGRAKILENGDLFISSFNNLDAGNYTCDVAANVPLMVFEVYPKSVPGSLLDVRVIPNTVLMLITWRELENNIESPINITIRYRVIDDSILIPDWKVLRVEPSKNQKEIYSLQPNTLYKIEIWASNEIGDGEKTELTTKTLSDMTESELEKHLLEGIDKFDTRVWTFAVIVIMSTFSIFGIALCFLFIKDPRIQKRLDDTDDIERIELIPNITINPGYCET